MNSASNSSRSSSPRSHWPALLAIAWLSSAAGVRGADSPVPVPVLVIATYETGKDRGDVPGELQFWSERQNLDQSIRVPGVDHPVLTNGKGLYAMVSGTTSRCAVQIMALAADPRFDLRRTYFLLSGIGGGDPKVISLASAVWVQHVVDGNPAFEIDSREISPSWPYGLVALRAGGLWRDHTWKRIGKCRLGARCRGVRGGRGRGRLRRFQTQPIVGQVGL